MFKQSLLLVGLLILNGCASDDDKLEALLKKAKENMVFVKGGEFMMGDPGAFHNEEGKTPIERWPIGSPENRKKYPYAPWQSITGNTGNIPHKVILSDYYISKYEVTWEEFDTYYELTNREVYKKSSIEYEEYWRTPKHPAWTPSWTEAKNFCRFLAKHSGLNYDLPTEAQWEYAARNRGKYVAYATDNGWAYIFDKTSENWGDLAKNQNVADKKRPVGSYPPNPLGIYDMTGNISEWVNDWYSEEYFKNSPIKDPKGPKSSALKVLRSSSSSDIQYMSVYVRYGEKLSRYSEGFRCVLNP